jgi:hypothetical protein
MDCPSTSYYCGCIDGYIFIYICSMEDMHRESIYNYTHLHICSYVYLISGK